MYIRESKKTVRGKTYVNHVLVESVLTPKGPRQKAVCSLGDLGPKPRGEWLKLVDRVEEALVGQGDWVDGADEQVLEIVEKVRAARQRKPRKAIAKGREEAGKEASDVVAVHTDRVMMEEPHPHGG